MKTRKTPTHFECKHCHAVNKWNYSSYNIFCNNKCQQSYEWEHVTKPKIERGEATSNSHGIVRRYLSETRGPCCEECGCPDVWNNKPLTLHVDHIDGNSENNVVENLRLLCPNCHAQTDNYGSKNKRSPGRRAEYYDTYRQKQV